MAATTDLEDTVNDAAKARINVNMAALVADVLLHTLASLSPAEQWAFLEATRKAVAQYEHDLFAATLADHGGLDSYGAVRRTAGILGIPEGTARRRASNLRKQEEH